MTTEDKALKGQMMVEAEEAINQLLAGVGEKEDLKLSDIERLVRVAGEQVMERFTARLVEAGAREVEGRICPVCGRMARYKGAEVSRPGHRDRRSASRASPLLLP
jgi:hypothetical protein